jgi:chemotaxis family two-component system response regulator Rcp1
MGTTEILIVEDNPADAKLAAEALREASVSTHVTIKPAREEAMAFLRDPLAPRNDLIFMDLHLPGKGGLEVLEELQRDTRLKNIPVVILTGSIDPKELAELKKYQNFQHLIKPNVLDEYITHMKAILESVSVH